MVRYSVSRHGKFLFRTDWFASEYWSKEAEEAITSFFLARHGYQVDKDVKSDVAESTNITIKG